MKDEAKVKGEMYGTANPLKIRMVKMQRQREELERQREERKRRFLREADEFEERTRQEIDKENAKV